MLNAAIHEAGHVVMALEQRVRVNYASVENFNDGEVDTE